MPWYKIDVSCGPGHMSHSVEYIYSDTPLTAGAQKDEFHRYARQWDDGENSVVGEIKRVRRLPQDVRKQKILEYRRQGENALYMLRVLGV